MAKPREVFDNPTTHWDFITTADDKDFEGQCFDRKEAPQIAGNGFVRGSDLKAFVADSIVKTVSAFANSNPEGGLLVIGVSKTGQVKGVGHLNDEQRQSLVDFTSKLRGQASQIRTFDCADETGRIQPVLLIYVPFSRDCICETAEKVPSFWTRTDNRTMTGDDRIREQLKRDKHVVVFENQLCCPFRPQEVDQGVLDEFRRSASGDEDFDTTDEDFLFNVGALDYGEGNRLFFTNAGYLFFSNNPQRVLPQAHLRLLRFEVGVEDEDRKGAPSFEKEFSGPISKQIRDARKFFQDSAYFRVLPRRNPEGGFLDESEYPFQVVDEAIVNALAHRDYSVPLPVECEAFQDALQIINAGRILQRNHDVPATFSLRDTQLHHLPRNPKLLQWLKSMKDERGRQFVRAVSEGTKTMRKVMEDAELPAPTYSTGDTQTQVRLFNNERERKALLKITSAPSSAEFCNLFLLEVYPEEKSSEGGGGTAQSPENGVVLDVLRSHLHALGWYVHSKKFGRLVVSRKGMEIKVPGDVARVVRIFPSFALSVRNHWDHHYLCIDYSPKVRNLLRLNFLLSCFDVGAFNGFSARALSGRWRRCRVVEANEDYSLVRFDDTFQEETVASTDVMPEMPVWMIQDVINKQGIRFDLLRAVKEHSLSLRPGTARTRFGKIQAVATDLADNVFPISVQQWSFDLRDRPTSLRRQGEPNEPFQVRSLPEPSVEFFRNHESPDIRDGITRFGSYDHEATTIEIVPIALAAQRTAMSELIARLQVGKFKYRGAERTFGVRFNFSSVVTVPTASEILGECQRLLRERPNWVGDPSRRRIFLVHTPSVGWSSDDENSPYYLVKRFLLEQGVPCQMVDTPTLQNADYKDLNLALNLTAKCGITPWVLPDQIPDADFFIGLSYTQSGRRGQERLMGYANVFNQYGRWEFYSGSTQTFSFDDRAARFGELAKTTLERLSDRLSETPNIYFHYSAKFSRYDRDAVLQAVREVCPRGTFTFVSINSHHDVRLFDSRPETDGSLTRGSYVLSSPTQIFLSTTGHNPYRKALGTPQMLELSARVERPTDLPSHPVDLRVLAIQILNLTKLNWASTDSLCGEPITTKYAGDIAYLTAAFLRQKSDFRLHPVLENTPWFI